MLNVETERIKKIDKLNTVTYYSMIFTFITTHEIPPPRRDWARGVRPEVAKQHDVFAGAIAVGILVRARASFWWDKNIRKLFECFHEDWPKPALNNHDGDVWKTSLKKRINVSINYFAIIPTRSICLMWSKCPGTEYIGTEFKSW